MGRSFNGSTDQASVSGVGTAVDLTGAQMSASCWFMLTSAPSKEVDPLCKWAAGGNGGYFIGYNTSGHANQITASIYISISLNHNHTIFAANSVGLNTWFQAAFRYQNNNNMELWVDGVKAATDSGVGSTGVLVSSNNNLLFGAPRPSISGLNFPGLIAESAVWNTYLSNAEMASLVNICPNGVRPSAIVGYWPFEGTSGTSIEPDLSGNILNATLTGTTPSVHPPCVPISQV